MKKSIAIALMLVLFWVGNTSMVQVKASPGVLNVGPGQTYAKITDALAVAVSGDVIHVWNNLNPYVENPVINIPNIKIIGQSVAGVTINPDLILPVPCFDIQASGVTIMELTIEDTSMGAGDIGVRILGPSSQCKIWNNVILNFDYGIVIENSPNNEIIGNEVSNCMVTLGPPPWCSTGVYLLGAGSTNNQVRGNDLGLTAPNWYGVGTNNGASGNTITFNNFWASANIPQAFALWGFDINTWDSSLSGLPKGNFWNDPMGWPPPYMIDPFNVDNFCSPAPYDWTVMPYDLNRDGRVDMKDLAPVALAYGSQWSMLRWNPKADVYGDGKIDIKDIAWISKRYGWIDP